LQRCYEIASPRVHQYLEAEIQHVQGRLRSTDVVLELGCGYGRVAFRLAQNTRRVVGIDSSEESLKLAEQMAGSGSRCQYMHMDALELQFADSEFDAVVCVQNGICAFGVDQESLLREALRVVRSGGLALFSTYSDRFWPDRLAWFELQAAEELVGPIDYEASGAGTVVCTDGFRAGRLMPKEFESLCLRLGLECEIAEVDSSSMFCEITKPCAS
jgi:2-polyprenyl-6-hydroxyphenyl methylase/3-demethylubiquinone-9 3-methyltransferase